MSKNLTFIVAVLSVINDFRLKQQSFSAYQVTQELRSRVNNGSLTFSDRQSETIENVTTYRVERDEVRNIISELYDNGLLFGLQRGNARTGSSSYVIYECKPPVATPAAVPVTTSLTPRVNNSVYLPGSTGKTTITSVLPPQWVANAIASYIIRKFQKGQNPSLKQIQSRFKTTPLSTSEIRGYVEKAGYKIQAQSGLKPSLSIVTR
jgi:hypothetical protein